MAKQPVSGAGPSANPVPPVTSQGARKGIWVIEKVEEGSAAVEVDGRQVINVPSWMLPSGVAEGDVLAVTLVVDQAERERRLDRSRAQTSVKSKNDKPGDITL